MLPRPECDNEKGTTSAPACNQDPVTAMSAVLSWTKRRRSGQTCSVMSRKHALPVARPSGSAVSQSRIPAPTSPDDGLTNLRGTLEAGRWAPPKVALWRSSWGVMQVSAAGDTIWGRERRYGRVPRQAVCLLFNCGAGLPRLRTEAPVVLWLVILVAGHDPIRVESVQQRRVGLCLWCVCLRIACIVTDI